MSAMKKISTRSSGAAATSTGSDKGKESVADPVTSVLTDDPELAPEHHPMLKESAYQKFKTSHLKEQRTRCIKDAEKGNRWFPTVQSLKDAGHWEKGINHSDTCNLVVPGNVFMAWVGATFRAFNNDLQHNEYLYHEGTNVLGWDPHYPGKSGSGLKEKLDVTRRDCGKGGIYAADINGIGNWIGRYNGSQNTKKVCLIAVPDDAIVVLTSSNKIRTDEFVTGTLIDIDDIVNEYKKTVPSSSRSKLPSRNCERYKCMIAWYFYTKCSFARNATTLKCAMIADSSLLTSLDADQILEMIQQTPEIVANLENPDTDLVFEALRIKPSVYGDLKESDRTPEMAEFVVEESSRMFKYIPKEQLTNAMTLTAVTVDPSKPGRDIDSVRYTASRIVGDIPVSRADNPAWMDENLATKLVLVMPSLISENSMRFWRTPAVIRAYVIAGGDLKYLYPAEFCNPEMLIIALEANGKNILTYNKAGYPLTDADWATAIETTPSVFSHCPNQTEALCLLAFQGTEPISLRNVKDEFRTPKVLIAALEVDPHNLKHFKDADRAVIDQGLWVKITELVSQDPKIFLNLALPSPDSGISDDDLSNLKIIHQALFKGAVSVEPDVLIDVLKRNKKYKKSTKDAHRVLDVDDNDVLAAIKARGELIKDPVLQKIDISDAVRKQLWVSAIESEPKLFGKMDQKHQTPENALATMQSFPWVYTVIRDDIRYAKNADGTFTTNALTLLHLYLDVSLAKKTVDDVETVTGSDGYNLLDDQVKAEAAAYLLSVYGVDVSAQ